MSTIGNTGRNSVSAIESTARDIASPNGYSVSINRSTDRDSGYLDWKYWQALEMP